jgi:hypothetical protein
MGLGRRSNRHAVYQLLQVRLPQNPREWELAMNATGTLTCPKCGTETSWPNRCDCTKEQTDKPGETPLSSALGDIERRVVDMIRHIGVKAGVADTVYGAMCHEARCILRNVEVDYPQSATRAISHVICFEGEGAEILLCHGWEDCREQFFNGIFGDGHHDWDEEQVKLWDKDFADDDNWSFDEDRQRYRFTSDVGEISKVRIYQLNPPRYVGRSSAE